MKFRNLLVIFLTTTMFACASNPKQQVEQEDNVSDPFESVNRGIWYFNYEVLDRYLLKPVTKGYVAVTPQPVRTGLLNFSNNLDEPVNFIANILEGSFEQSGVNFGRFVINTTVGIFGIFDVASSLNLAPAEEDLGQAFGTWGVGTGPYLMLPVFGPSEVRDLTGTVIDNLVIQDALYTDALRLAGTVIGTLETRAALLDQEETLESALDQYIFVRDAYFQRLAFQLRDGEFAETSEEEALQNEADFSEFEDLLNDQ